MRQVSASQSKCVDVPTARQAKLKKVTLGWGRGNLSGVALQAHTNQNVTITRGSCQKFWVKECSRKNKKYIARTVARADRCPRSTVRSWCTTA